MDTVMFWTTVYLAVGIFGFILAVVLGLFFGDLADEFISLFGLLGKTE